MTALIFFLVLSALVIAHELGHFLAARAFGVKAHEFGIGLPPRLFGIVKDGKRWKLVRRGGAIVYKNTIVSVNALPFGGFVRIKGEADGEAEAPDSMLVKPMWQRACIIAAGVFMNWMVAIMLLSTVLFVGTTTVLDNLPANANITDRSIQVTDVLPGSPAALGGLVRGDSIVSINGQAMSDANSTSQSIRAMAAIGPVLIQYRHDAEMRSANLVPVILSEIQAPGIGVGLVDIGKVSFGPIGAISQGISLTARITRDVFFAFGGLVRDIVMTRHVSSDVSGPVGIAVLTGEAARAGMTTLMQFAAMLSINLAVINVLPIPALDGGRLFFMLIEKMRRKPLKRHVEIRIHNAAYLALIALIVLVTVRDVGRYGGSAMGGLKLWLGM